MSRDLEAESVVITHTPIVASSAVATAAIYHGPAGPPGEIGDRGPEGPPGPAGEQGPTGATIAGQDDPFLALAQALERITELEEELEQARKPWRGPDRKTRLERGWTGARFTD